ncbi:MAG: outer membrane protein assembly factor BamD [Deltaproteobacteria bacterium]|nr:outer membrane protein assembly factor BamD [Deltaproteobacteria bacterium]
MISTPTWACLFMFLATAVACDAQENVKVALASSPRENFQRGLKAYNKGEWAEAEKYFNYTKARGHGDWAVLAEIRLADTYFERERYAEAVDAYQLFTKTHSTHPEADHATYRIALSAFRQIPDDWFILPPAHERDLRSTTDARRALENYLARYPNGRYAANARTEYLEIRSRLISYEIYAADFYANRAKWPAVVLRLEFAMREYPGMGRDEEILFKLGSAYISSGDFGRGVETLKSVIARFPGGRYRKAAEKIVARVVPKR